MKVQSKNLIPLYQCHPQKMLMEHHVNTFWNLLILPWLKTFVLKQIYIIYLQKTGNSDNFTISEVQQFLGTYLLMGIVKMPSVRTYWENCTQFSDIADVMSQNRFETLLRYFHFTNNLEVSDEKKKSTKL